MKKLCVALSILMSCVLLVNATQLSTHARTTAAKKIKLAQIPAYSVASFIQDVIKASDACLPPKNTAVKTLSSFPVRNNAKELICKELVALVQANNKVVTTGGVIELPLLAQIFNVLVGAGAGLTAAGAATIAGIIVSVLLIIGLTWCITYGETCKSHYDSIKRSLDEFYNVHVLSMLRTWTHGQRMQQIDQSVKSNLNKEWNNTRNEINKGISPTKIRDGLQKRLSNTPPPSNNNQQPGSGFIPPQSPKQNQEFPFSVTFLSPDQIDQIRKIDEKCASEIIALQLDLLRLLKALNSLDARDIPKLRKTLDAVMSNILARISKKLSDLRGTLESAKGKISHLGNELLLNNVIKHLPTSTTSNMARKDVVGLYRAIKKYLNLDNTGLTNIVVPKNFFSQASQFDQLMFRLLSELHYILIYQHLKFNELLKFDYTLCSRYAAHRDQLESETELNLSQIKDFLCDLIYFLELKNNDKVGDLCKRYAYGYRIFIHVTTKLTIENYPNRKNAHIINSENLYVNIILEKIDDIIRFINTFLGK